MSSHPETHTKVAASGTRTPKVRLAVYCRTGLFSACVCAVAVRRPVRMGAGPHRGPASDRASMKPEPAPVPAPGQVEAPIR